MSFSIQEKKDKIDFQDGNFGGHLVFLIGAILVFFIYVTLMILTKFQVSWTFSSGEEVKQWIFKMAAMVAILDL